MPGCRQRLCGWRAADLRPGGLTRPGTSEPTPRWGWVGGPPAGSPSQSVTSGSPRISVLTPGMTWSYWCRTSTQCTVNSLSFWDRPCSSSTVSRRHRTVRLCCSVRGGPPARRTVSHCLCSTTVSALTTCGRARAEVRACGLCTRTTSLAGQPRS